MSASTRKQIEDAVVGLLGALVPATLLAVKPYRGELGQDPAEIKRALGAFPGVLVTTGNARFTEISIGRRRAVKDQQVEILLANVSYRGREEAVRNDVSDDAGEGVQRAAELILDILFGVEMGVAGVGLLIPVAEDVLLQTPDLTIWKLTYACPVDTKRPAPVEDDLTQIVAKHNAPADEDQAGNPLVTADTDLP